MYSCLKDENNPTGLNTTMQNDEQTLQKEEHNYNHKHTYGPHSLQHIVPFTTDHPTLPPEKADTNTHTKPTSSNQTPSVKKADKHKHI
jgi:hypothetical protein